MQLHKNTQDLISHVRAITKNGEEIPNGEELAKAKAALLEITKELSELDKEKFDLDMPSNEALVSMFASLPMFYQKELMFFAASNFTKSIKSFVALRKVMLKAADGDVTMDPIEAIMKLLEQLPKGLK